MSNVFPLNQQSNLSTPVGPIDGGGQPPYDGVMEARVTKLEDFAQDTRERMVRVETKLDHIDKEVSNFKWWAAGSVVAIWLAVIGTNYGIQQMTVATFQAASQQSAPSPQPPIIINVPPPQQAQPPSR